MPFLLLMPSYNQAHFIGEAVDSCLAQTDPDWSLWILDNSTDGTPEVMGRFSDPRIRFIHLPGRMDPGACLNWMLARAEGREFAYIHTDNRLGKEFVAACRSALAGHPMSLCYCDHRMIDERGRDLGIDARFDYDLGNLLGSRALGVSFAATTALAKAIGGFAENCLADDVLFCSQAFGLGPLVRIPRPLVEYRIHPRSRTLQSGLDRVAEAVLGAQSQALAELERRGLDPLDAMARRLASIQDDLELLASEEMHRLSLPWNGRSSALQALWDQGLLRLPGFGSKHQGMKGGPPDGRAASLLPWVYRKLRLRSLLRKISQRHAEFRSVSVGLSWLLARRAGATTRTACVQSEDPLALWAGHWLRVDLGWRVLLHPELGGASRRLPWERGHPGDGDLTVAKASGSHPLSIGIAGPGA